MTKLITLYEARKPKKRNLQYEKKFMKYLFSFDFETHKEICKNINVKHNQGKEE